jgi:hypothetical protein
MGSAVYLVCVSAAELNYSQLTQWFDQLQRPVMPGGVQLLRSL